MVNAVLIMAGMLIVLPVFAAFTGSDFDTISTVRDHYAPGSDNALIAEFQLPDPATDTVLTNGATDVISPGDSLSSFGGTNKYYDANSDSTYDDTEGVATSSDELLSSTDIVITDISSILTSFPAVPEETDIDTAIGWIESGPTAGAYDSSENLGTLLRNASSAINGSQVRLFPSDIAYLADANGSSYSVSEDNALVEDSDADGYLSAGDTVLIAGRASVHRFDTSDGVCFDASISADSEYDAGEVIWLDAAGTCAAFTTGDDIILSGSGTPSGTSTEFGVENEVGFLDGNTNDVYNCTRGGDCEAIVYSGAHGTDLTTDGSLAVPTIFFDGSSEGVDGVRTVADSWDEASNALETIVFFSERTSSGQAAYFYLDADANADFTTTDPLALSVIKGSTLSTGQIWRTFYSNNHYFYDKDGDGQYRVNETGHDGLVLSSDAILNAGALDGSGEDKVLVAERIGGDGSSAWSTFLSQEKYHDHDSSGSYADGDDIVNDVDANGYYNADDLLSIKIDDEIGDLEDSHLEGIYIYERTGVTCVGSGVDTLIGSDVSTPFLSQAITITKNPYTASDTTNSKTLCVYADISASAPVTTKWWPTVPSNGIVFASGTVSSPIELRNGTDIYISHGATATLTSSSRVPSATATYTASYTQGATAAPAGSNAYIVFPADYDISGGGIACTDDGASISGTPFIFGQIIAVTNISAQIEAGSAISCVVSGVINPEDEGETGVFYIGTTSGLSPYTIDDDNTITISELIPGRGGRLYSPTKTYTLELDSPIGGEVYVKGAAVPITWRNTGNDSMSHVNIYVSLNNGEAYTKIAAFTANDGYYLWHPTEPSHSARIKIAATDLAVEVATDTSDSSFTILASAHEDTASEDESGEESGPVVVACPHPLPDGIAVGDYLLGRNMDGSTYPAVYYVASDCKRHPFLNEVTFYTYQDDFSIVRIIPINLLEQVVEGRTMPVNPGVILVKTPTSPDVYYVHGQTGDTSPLLIKIRSEQEALRYFGSGWSESVLDISAPLLSLYTTTSSTIDGILNGIPKTLRSRYTLGQ